jgi:hypothetical protein
MINNIKMFNCVLCKKTFCTKFNLERHTNSCKGNPIITKFRCDYCLKYYATKQTLQNHHENCSKRSDINKQLKDVNLKMKELENKLIKQELNSKVVNNTTNITNNNNKTVNNYTFLYGMEPLDLSQKRFDNIVENRYTEEVHRNLRLVSEVILKFLSNDKDKIVGLLTDENRMKIKCINDKLEIEVHDPSTLIGFCKSSKPLKNKSEKYMEKDYEANSKEYSREQALRTTPSALLSGLKFHKKKFLRKKKSADNLIEPKIIFVED